ncbi:MAG: metallophosphoesterase [Verrucomicrobia bacterium]|nr:metallophosphoesterase [Verrucomicrobiota bacterium]MCH8525557.1 metallophosphoesterase [Kiritimatiellia bacterium]
MTDKHLQRGAWEWTSTYPDGSRGPAASRLADALAPVPLPWVRCSRWPRAWTVFATEEPRRILRACGLKYAVEAPPHTDHIPEELEHSGRTWRRRVLEADERGVLDLADAFGQAFDGRTAFLYAELPLDAPVELRVHAGADYRMEWWIDGQRGYDTLKGGNGSPVTGRSHAFDLNLEAGRHLFMVRVVSGSGGWGFASEALQRVGGELSESFGLEARRRFVVEDPEQLISLTLEDGNDPGLRLNGEPVPVPLPGMRYRDIPGIPVSCLRPGENLLSRSWRPEEVWQVREDLALEVFSATAAGELPRVSGTPRGVGPREVCLQTAPVLGWATASSLTMACRTNAPVSLHVDIDGHRHHSATGLVHHFVCDGLQGGTDYAYRVSWTDDSGDETVLFKGQAKTLPEGADHFFVFMGDVYPFDDTWERVSGAVVDEGPDAVFFSGDMVLDGSQDAEWDEGFFHPAQTLLASVPFYAVIGNHENNGALFDQLFLTPEVRNWEQRIGAMNIIGIDGTRDWTPGGADHEWLEEVLRSSDAPFVFLMTHYPPFSSGGHGRVDEAGRPKEEPIRQARDFLMPLLTRHAVTAVVSGHDHFYERSELPGGVTGLVSAGAGSRLYSKTTNPLQNPHSVFWQSDYHFCRVRVRPETCTLQAVLLDGSVIDERTWEPRNCPNGKH